MCIITWLLAAREFARSRLRPEAESSLCPTSPLDWRGWGHRKRTGAKEGLRAAPQATGCNVRAQGRSKQHVCCHKIPCYGSEGNKRAMASGPAQRRHLNPDVELLSSTARDQTPMPKYKSTRNLKNAQNDGRRRPSVTNPTANSGRSKAMAAASAVTPPRHARARSRHPIGRPSHELPSGLRPTGSGEGA